MNRYIDADKAKELWSGEHPTQIAMRRIFDDLPTADVATKSGVAMEIFEEIENSISPMLGLEDDKEYVAILATTFAELKKKYIHEKDCWEK